MYLHVLKRKFVLRYILRVDKNKCLNLDVFISAILFSSKNTVGCLQNKKKEIYNQSR